MTLFKPLALGKTLLPRRCCRPRDDKSNQEIKKNKETMSLFGAGGVQNFMPTTADRSVNSVFCLPRELADFAAWRLRFRNLNVTRSQVSPFEQTNHYIREASRKMELGARSSAFFLTPEGEHHVTVPIERDNGELAVFAAIAFSTPARGPMKGGLRFHPSVGRGSPRWLR
jgi:hypothetical protein